MRTTIRLCLSTVAAATFGFVANADAHSASDAYLTLTSETSATNVAVHGQWDIAIRDLDFVLRIDGDGDGDITWRELRTRLPAIEKYAFAQLSFRHGGSGCRIVPGRRLVTDHADGAYVALFFDATCPAGPQAVTLDYRLFFAIDPSHRAIVVWRAGNDAATAVLSPARPTISVRHDAR